MRRFDVCNEHYRTRSAPALLKEFSRARDCAAERLMKPFRLFLLICLAGPVLAEEPAIADMRPPSEAPARIHQTVSAVYPARLLHRGITRGEARLLLEIDRRGNLTDVLPIAFTHHSFADSAVDAARRWRYEPARVGGEMVAVIAEVTFVFGTTGVVAVEKRGGDTPTNWDVLEKRYVYWPHGVSTIDKLPKPIDVPPPVYPEEWAEDGRKGRITVTFFIDEEGQARFPMVQHEADEWLAGVAVAAVRKWRFAPCTANGRPVLVRAQQVFSFGVDSERAAKVTRK